MVLRCLKVLVSAGMRRVRLGVYFVVSLVVTCHTIRLVMFSEVRPFDWIMLAVEVLVLALIAYEVGVPLYKRKKTSERTKILFSLMSEGQAILRKAPSVGQFTEADRWAKSVDSWTVKVENQLTAYSPQAAVAFAQAVKLDVRIPHVAPGVELHYRIITEKLENLRNITEKADVYY